MRNNDNSSYLLSSLANALDVLDFLSCHPKLSLTEICTQLNLSKGSCFRILYTLMDRGYVHKTPDSRYQLSFKFLHYGNKISNQMDLITICKPYMQQIRDKFNETVHLVILNEKGDGIFIHKENSTRLFQMMSRIGYSRSAYQLGTGKVLLAYLPKDLQTQFANSYHYEQLTKNTISSAQELIRQLQIIRECGYSYDNEESEYGLTCTAAPVFDATGECIAAMSISGSTASVQESRQEYLDELLSACRKCSAELGYSFS